MRVAAFLTALVLVPIVAAATRPPQVRALTLPSSAVVGAAWRAVVSIRPA